MNAPAAKRNRALTQSRCGSCMNLSNPVGILACILVGIGLPSCSSAGDSVAIDAGGDAPAEADLPDDFVPIPKTAVCAGDTMFCLSGTLALQDFTAMPTAAKVTLYRRFPSGDAKVTAWTPVADDGTFAFSGLDKGQHYYVQAEVRFGNGAHATGVASTVGSFTIPAPSTPIAIVVRPVFLEVLQQAPSGGATTLSWASAHLYDPASGKEVTGKEVTDGSVSLSVSLTAGGMSFPMPYGKNAGDTNSFNVNLPAGTPGGTTFTITTSYPELASSPKKWNLTGEPATFGGSIVSLTSGGSIVSLTGGTVPAKTPLTVKWQPEPMASYSQTVLFEQEGKKYVQRYISPTVNAPDVTTETIPASALGSSGSYLLNEGYANPTCPTTADGCVYNVSTAVVNLTVQ